MSFSRDNNWENLAKMNNNEENNNHGISYVYRCRKCGGERTISMEMQTRSADEPLDVLNVEIVGEFKMNLVIMIIKKIIIIFYYIIISKKNINYYILFNNFILFLFILQLIIILKIIFYLIIK